MLTGSALDSKTWLHVGCIGAGSRRLEIKVIEVCSLGSLLSRAVRMVVQFSQMSACWRSVNSLPREHGSAVCLARRRPPSRLCQWYTGSCKIPEKLPDTLTKQGPVMDFCEQPKDIS